MEQNLFSDAFDRRAASYSASRILEYNQANLKFPAARATERRLLIDLLDPRPGNTICDVAAGGGYLADGIYEALGGDCDICCVENSVHFFESLPSYYRRVYCSLSRLGLPTSSVDRMACLAGLHHQHYKQPFFNEAFRVMRKGGVIAVADVLYGSAPAHFLNVEVDRWSDLGHDGVFLHPGEFTSLLNKAGFIDIAEKVLHYTWDLPSHADLAWFCKMLFRMTSAKLNDVEEVLHHYFTLQAEPGIIRLPWSLVYARGRKPQ